jgi:hypothetical protein
MLFVNNQFGRDDNLLQEIRQAGDANINLISFDLSLDWHTTADEAAKVLDAFCGANPKAFFYLRIWVGPNQAWAEAHPQDCITKADGAHLGMASPSSEAWRLDAAEQLRKRIKEIASGPYAERFIGVNLSYLNTAEWFYPDANDFMDYSPVNLAAFRAWLKKKYKNDVALEEAWNDEHVTRETAAFPTPQERDREDWGVFRNPSKSRRSMDMQEFQSALVADTISYFAGVVKAATQRRSLVGAFYGYSMELNGNGPRALAQSGHLGLGRLLACKDIDLIHAPYSYFQRRLGEPGHLHLPIDSVALHNKVGVMEEDTFTHLSKEPDAKLTAPGWAERTLNIEETLSATRRNFSTMLTHRCGLWYCDLLSDGSWSDPKFWSSTPLLRRMAAELRSAGPFRPEIAFAVSEESVHVLHASTTPLLAESLYLWRSELDRIGTPVGYYLQSDLPLLPDSVKFLILPNAYILKDAERAAIRKVLKRGGTVLWTYAPDIAGPNRLDPTRIGDLTGIEVEATLDTVSPSFSSEVSEEAMSFGDERWSPRFHVTSSDVHVLARYQENHEVSAAATPLDGGVSVYTATPRVPVGMLRWICQRSGIRLYRNTPGMTGVVGNYLIVHTEAAGPVELRWPVPCETVERLTPYASLPVAHGSDTWTDTLPEKTTAIYLCTPQSKASKSLRKKTLDTDDLP